MISSRWLIFYCIVEALVAHCATVRTASSPNVLAAREPYAFVTDIDDGAVCVYDTDHPNEELPLECVCTFENLRAIEKKCALLEETSDTETKKKCQEIPCEVCCKAIFDKKASPGHGKAARLECVKTCPNSEKTMDVTDAATPIVLTKLQEYASLYFPTPPPVKQRRIVKQPPTPALHPVGQHRAIIVEVPLKSEAEALEERMKTLQQTTVQVPLPTPEEIMKISEGNERLVEAVGQGGQGQSKHILSPFEEI